MAGQIPRASPLQPMSVTNMPSQRPKPNPRRIGPTALGVAVTGAAVCVFAAVALAPGLRGSAGPPSSPTPLPSPRVLPAIPGVLEPGRYRVSAPPSSWIRVTVPAGWSDVSNERGGGLIKGEAATLHFGPVGSLVADPCPGGGSRGTEEIPVGPTVADLVAALGSLPVLEVSPPQQITSEGNQGMQLELTNPGPACPYFDLWRTPASFGEWWDVELRAGWHGVVRILDVDGRRFAIVASSRLEAGTDVERELSEILDSIEIEPIHASTSPSASEPAPTASMLPDLPLPGARGGFMGEYGWTGSPSSIGRMHHVVDGGNGNFRQTQLVFTVRDDCFANGDGPNPVPVTVAGFDGLYVEPYDDPGVLFAVQGGERTGAYALAVGGRTLCVYLSWDPTTTQAELDAGRAVVESIRAQPIGPNGIRIVFTLPGGWDTG